MKIIINAERILTMAMAISSAIFSGCSSNSKSNAESPKLTINTVGATSSLSIANETDTVDILESGSLDIEIKDDASTVYNYKVLKNPIGQECDIINGTPSSDESSVVLFIYCTEVDYLLSGYASGINGEVVIDFGDGNESVFRDGEFEINKTFNSGEEFELRVKSSEMELDCEIQNGSGVFLDKDIKNVNLQCSDPLIGCWTQVEESPGITECFESNGTWEQRFSGEYRVGEWRRTSKNNFVTEHPDYGLTRFFVEFPSKNEIKVTYPDDGIVYTFLRKMN